MAGTIFLILKLHLVLVEIMDIEIYDMVRLIISRSFK